MREKMKPEMIFPDGECHVGLPDVPNSSDVLLTSAEDWWNNACLHFCHNEWPIYTVGYKEAADILVAHVEEEGRHSDILLYPTLFLYRQYLELALKGLIRRANLLLDIRAPFPKTHRIDHLWRICERLLNQVSPDDATEELTQIDRLINEFSHADPTSESFRYPESRAGDRTLLGLTHINLRNVKDVIAKIALILDGAATQIEEYLSVKWDMQQDFV